MSRLYRRIPLIAAAVVVQTAWAQEIGMVTIEPNAATGELRADIPARPDNETVYIMRDGERIATATVKSSGQPGGALLTMPAADATRVRKGDRISLTPDLSREQQLPASAYLPVDPTARAITPEPTPQGSTAPPPSLSSVMTETKTTVERTTRRPAAKSEARTETASALPVKGSMPERTGASNMRQQAAPVSPRLTPRGSSIPLYPAPAIVAEAGVTAPYGVGLAAAAPVGTPFLRSPAFAGPPVIYMPQTVSRVLLPAVTPYPANVMYPPVRYPYASAPFTRTDVYVNLPYGTYYWPNGYAGTTPVEPQIPVYVTAPASAVLTTEASYTTQRYAPGAAMAETLNPITVPPAAAAGDAVEPDLIPIVPAGDVATGFPNNPGAPPPSGGDFGGATAAPAPGAPVAGVALAPASLPPLQPLNPFPAAGATGAPEPAAFAPTTLEAPPLPNTSLPPLSPTGATLPAPVAPFPAPGAPSSGPSLPPLGAPTGLPPLPPLSGADQGPPPALPNISDSSAPASPLAAGVNRG